MYLRHSCHKVISFFSLYVRYLRGVICVFSLCMVCILLSVCVYIPRTSFVRLILIWKFIHSASCVLINDYADLIISLSFWPIFSIGLLTIDDGEMRNLCFGCKCCTR